MTASAPFRFEEPPYVTKHAEKRWIERSTSCDVTPEEAWDKGISIELSKRDYDEARLSLCGDVVLLRKNENIVTVLDVDDVWCPQTIGVIHQLENEN